MKTAVFRCLALLLFTVAWLAAAEETAWKTYRNERFGFLLRYPGSLEASRAPDNGAGREFHTADKEFSLVAQGHFMGGADENDSLEKRWEEELRGRGKTVSYKKKGPSWYAVSGVNPDGTEYYTKFYVQDKNWVSLHITYPHAKNKKYDPWVERIVKEFQPFLKGDFDRIK